jgi:hypothetical protein
MKRAVLVVLVLAIGCASTGFHEGRTALRKEEQACLVAKKGAPKGVVFERFWTAPRLVAIGLVQWQEDRSWACPQAPADLLQSMRDEMGRLNQRYRVGENISLAVTVYRFDKGGIWSGPPTAHYELVARNGKGQVVWAADDKIEAPGSLARTVADTSSAMIGREVLRKVRQQFGL